MDRITSTETTRRSASSFFRKFPERRVGLAALLILLVLSGCADGAVVRSVSLEPGSGQVKLPLVENPSGAGGDLLAVMVTGDGGWRRLDILVTRSLVARGIPVVGWSATWFRHRRTPDEASRDLAAILRHYSAAWGKRDFLLIGYSRGADVLPFMVTRLPQELRSHVRLVTLLGPSAGVDFYLPPLAFLHFGNETDYQVLPEIERLPPTRILCIKGSKESGSLCPAIPAGMANVVEIPGGHHFAGDYKRVAQTIAEAAK